MKGFIHAVLISALGVSSVAAQGFISSCDSKSIKVSGRYLTASCRNIIGQLQCNKLDLNSCLKNVYGRLVEDPNAEGPHLGDQCIDCSNTPELVANQPALLHCRCNPGTGASQPNWPTSYFDLNTTIDNVNGDLWCFNQKSTKC